MTTDTSERGLESIIFNSMIGAGWIPGKSSDYDREYCVDLVQLTAFLEDTQPKIAEALRLDSDNPTRRRFLSRLKKQVDGQGVVKTLRDVLERLSARHHTLLRNAVAGKRERSYAPRKEQVLDNAPVALQQNRSRPIP